ncbi:MAG: hypothetical protein ACOX3A_07420 [bacterium]
MSNDIRQCSQCGYKISNPLLTRCPLCQQLLVSPSCGESVPVVQGYGNA